MPSAFVAGVGTGGTLVGVGEYLRARVPGVAVHPLEPANSPTLRLGVKCGSHRIQGISDDFVPAIVDLSRLDPIVVDGAYVGQRLSVGAGGAPPKRIDLAAESFATGPTGGVVLIGSDDGRRSQLSLVDVTGGCAWAIGSSTDVVRSATVSSDGRSVIESRVDRRTRADLGIWRRPFDGTPPVRVLAAIGVARSAPRSNSSV